jgi:hypothetical protein
MAAAEKPGYHLRLTKGDTCQQKLLMGVLHYFPLRHSISPETGTEENRFLPRIWHGEYF